MDNNRELMTQWISRLRAGKDKKTIASLYNKETCGFCALGVLVDIMHPGELQSDPSKLRIEEFYAETAGVLEKFGMDYSQVYRKNDSYHATFPEIADWLEEKVGTKS